MDDSGQRTEKRASRVHTIVPPLPAATSLDIGTRTPIPVRPMAYPPKCRTAIWRSNRRPPRNGHAGGGAPPSPSRGGPPPPPQTDGPPLSRSAHNGPHACTREPRHGTGGGSRAVRPEQQERRLQQRLDALTPAPRAELLHVLMLPDLERADGIGEFWGYPDSRTYRRVPDRLRGGPDPPSGARGHAARGGAGRRDRLRISGSRYFA
jgi:hypothetical protein